jgi:hypothetical protein
MTAPYRPRAEYSIILLVGVLALGLGLGVAVAKYASTGFPFTSPSPSASPRPTAPASPSSPAPAAAAADWTRYTDTADDFALRYPAAWLQRTCAGGGHTTLYLAPTSATLGTCNSGNAGQIYIGAAGGDQRSTYTWATSGGYDNVKTQTVTVAGFTAARQTANVPDSAAAGPVPGTKMTQYIVYANGRTYIAVHAQAPGGPDTLADFDTMIKSTLEISPK